MSVFQIPQILGIITLFKNCQRFRDKCFASHQQESSLPGNIPSLHHTRSCTGAVAGIRKKTTSECRVIPVGTFHSMDSVGQTSLDALQLRNKTAEGLAPLFRSKNHLSGLHSWFLMCLEGGAALSQTWRGVGALEIVYLSLKHPILIFKCYKVLWC